MSKALEIYLGISTDVPYEPTTARSQAISKAAYGCRAHADFRAEIGHRRARFTAIRHGECMAAMPHNFHWPPPALHGMPSLPSALKRHLTAPRGHEKLRGGDPIVLPHVHHEESTVVANALILQCRDCARETHLYTNEGATNVLQALRYFGASADSALPPLNFRIR